MTGKIKARNVSVIIYISKLPDFVTVMGLESQLHDQLWSFVNTFNQFVNTFYRNRPPPEYQYLRGYLTGKLLRIQIGQIVPQLF